VYTIIFLDIDFLNISVYTCAVWTAGYLDQEKLRKSAAMSAAAAQLQAQNYSIEDKKLE